MTQLEMSNGNWKTKILLIGTLAGALVGLSTAYLLARTAEEENNGPPQISTGDALKASISVIGVARGIAALAGRKK
jgi:gas vesicle protein